MSRYVRFGPEPEERARAPDYWGVRTADAYFFVTAETAARLVAQLRRVWRPRWVVFVDLSGARVALRAGSIEMVAEATVEQRAFDRALMKALNEESEETRPW